MIKKMILGLVMALAMAMLTACGSATDTGFVENKENLESGGEGNKEQEVAKEGGKLVVWVAGTGDATYDEAWNYVLQAYAEEHNGFTYELTFIPWGEYFTKLNAAFSGGVGPDLFSVGYGQLGALQHNGNLLNLDEYINKDWDGWTDIPENILNQGRKDGALYGMLMPDVRTLMYRTDIAEQNGVTKEELSFSTIEELEALAEKMTVYDEKGNVQIAGFELRTSSAVSNEQNFFIFSSWYNENQLWNKDLTAAFVNEGNVKALEKMQEMLDKGVAVLNETGDGVSQLVNGTAAMTINIESTLPAAKMAYPEKVAAVAFDMDTLTLGTFYSVNAKTGNPELAADVLTYIFDVDAQKEFAAVMGQTPSRESLADWFIEQDEDGNNKEILEMYHHAVNYSDELNYKFLDLMSLLRAGIEDVLYNHANPEAVLEECAKQYNSMLNE